MWPFSTPTKPTILIARSEIVTIEDAIVYFNCDPQTVKKTFNGHARRIPNFNSIDKSSRPDLLYQIKSFLVGWKNLGIEVFDDQLIPFTNFIHGEITYVKREVTVTWKAKYETI